MVGVVKICEKGKFLQKYIYYKCYRDCKSAKKRCI